VALRGGPPAGVMVTVGVAPMIHALSLAIDAAAGTGRGRTLAISDAPVADAVELALPSSLQQAPSAGESIAIAGFVIARDGGGRLWCTSSGDRMMIRLPVG